MLDEITDTNVEDEGLENNDEIICSTFTAQIENNAVVEFIDEFSQYNVTEKNKIEFRRRPSDFSRFSFIDANISVENATDATDIEDLTPMHYFEKFIPKEI